MKKIDFKKLLFVSKWTSVIALILIQSACDVGTFSVSGQKVGTTPPTSLIYSNPNAVYKAGKTISENSPTNSGGEVTSYSILPALPNGLLFNPSTGKITGTPNCLAQSIVYSITATNSTGSTTSSVLIQIVAGDPTNISFTVGLSGNAQSASRGATLPAAFSATVTDLSGNPISGVTVIWSVIAGGGNLSAITASTNNSGIVTSTLTLGPAPGANTGKATIQGTTTASTFTATATTSPLTSNVWNLILANASSYAYSGLIDFNGPSNVCELSPTPQTDQDDSSSGFGGGSLDGAALWDTTSSYLRLGTGTSNIELDSSWTPAWNSIVGYWKLNGFGSINTASNNIPATIGSPGSSTNSNNSGMTYSTGKINQGIVFDGVDDIISAPSTNMPTGSGARTISLWFKSYSPPNSLKILAGYGLDNTGNLFMLSIGYGAGVSKLYLWGSSSNVAGNTTFSQNQWNHAVVTYDGTTTKLYLNGILDASGTPSLNTASGTPFYIGYGSIYQNFDGIIDDVAVWKTALSSSAVNSIYQHQSSVHTGTFTSRAMDGLSVAANWKSLSWVPTLPFLKELTNINETKSDYSASVNSADSNSDSSLATNLVGLWHFNETTVGTSPTGTDFADSSGNNKNGTLANPTNLDFKTPGVLSNGIHVNSNTPVINLPSGTFPTGASPRSFSMWIKVDTSVNQSLFSYGNYGNFSLFEILSYGGNLALHCYGPCDTIGSPTVPLTIGVWQHFAVTYDGTVARIYSNGQYFGQKTLALNTGTSMSIFGHGYYPNVNNSLDELAAWSRTLSGREILQVYRRGANRIKYQVRSCAANNCSDDLLGSNWKGPDGTNQSYFSELNNTSTQSANPSGNVNSTLPKMTFSNFTAPQPVVNRYFQYRAILESDDISSNCTYDNGSGPVPTWCSPELKSVAVGPNHYDTSAPSVVTKTGISFYSLSGAIETVGSGGCASGVVYNLGYGASYDTATWYYYNAGNWLVSGGAASTSNSAVSLNASSSAALAAFGNQIGTGTVYLKAFLQSSGESPCQLNSFEFDGLN